MNIPELSIKEYRQAVLEEDGRKLTFAEAREELRPLLLGFEAVLRVVKVEEKRV